MELLEHRIRNQRFQRLVFPICWLFVGIGLNLMGADKQSYKLAPYLGITGHRNQISQSQISCSKNCIKEVDIICTLFRQINASGSSFKDKYLHKNSRYHACCNFFQTIWNSLGYFRVWGRWLVHCIHLSSFHKYFLYGSSGKSWY